MKKSDLRNYYDKVKNHPYRLTFNRDLFKSYYNSIIELEGKILSFKDHERSPQLLLIDQMQHTINCDLSICRDNPFLYLSTYSIEIESFISLCHSFIDDSPCPICVLGPNHAILQKFKAVEDDEGKFRVIFIIDRKHVNGYIKAYSKLMTECLSSELRTEYKNLIDDLVYNKGKYFEIIEDVDS